MSGFIFLPLFPRFFRLFQINRLDAVEIVIMMQRKYGIPQTQVENKREIFATFASLADFIMANRTK